MTNGTFAKGSRAEIFLGINESGGDNLFHRVFCLEYEVSVSNSAGRVSDRLLLIDKEFLAANRHPGLGKLGDTRD
jgi:hypothetical protein